MTAPFDSAGYKIAYGLLVEDQTEGITTWDQTLYSDALWQFTEDSVGISVNVPFKPGYLLVGDIDSDAPAVQATVASNDSALAPSVASGSIIGRQAHLITWAFDASGTQQYKVDLHTIVMRAKHKGGVTTFDLQWFRPWATGIGTYGLPMLARCVWKYGGPECGVPADSPVCSKTTEFCRGKKVNLLATDNAASIETDASAWVAFGSGVTISLATTAAYHGSASLRAACDGTVGVQGVMLAPAGYASGSAGGTYCASAYVRAESGSATLRISLRWYDSAGNLIGTSTEYADVALSSSWQRVSVSATAPANTAKIGMHIVTTAATAVTFQLDAAMIERSRMTLRGAPSQFVLPSEGNLIRYGGLITAPRNGMVVRYLVLKPSGAYYVDRQPAPPPPAPPQPSPPPGARQVMRRLTPAPGARQVMRRLPAQPGGGGTLRPKLRKA